MLTSALNLILPSSNMSKSFTDDSLESASIYASILVSSLDNYDEVCEVIRIPHTTKDIFHIIYEGIEFQSIEEFRQEAMITGDLYWRPYYEQS